jgi:hypothetical protein
MIRRPLTVAAAGVAGLLGLAACGSDSSEPTVRAASPAPQAVTPFDVYYDLTHPDVATAAGPAAQVASPFDVYYDLTHPDVVNIRTRAPESVNQLEHRANVAQQQRAPESVNQLEHRANVAQQQRASESVNQLDQRAKVAWENQVLSQLADLAEEEGLTGLSPAFLQPIPQPIKR